MSSGSGLACPKCGNAFSKVIDTRSRSGGLSRRRRRQCSACGHRFSTIEIYDKSPTLLSLQAVTGIVEELRRCVLEAFGPGKAKKGAKRR